MSLLTSQTRLIWRCATSLAAARKQNDAEKIEDFRDALETYARFGMTAALREKCRSALALDEQRAAAAA